jgi:hypothetical protein
MALPLTAAVAVAVAGVAAVEVAVADAAVVVEGVGVRIQNCITPPSGGWGVCCQKPDWFLVCRF